jgi:hypothetical protein
MTGHAQARPPRGWCGTVERTIAERRAQTPPARKATLRTTYRHAAREGALQAHGGPSLHGVQLEPQPLPHQRVRKLRSQPLRQPARHLLGLLVPLASRRSAAACLLLLGFLLHRTPRYTPRTERRGTNSCGRYTAPHRPNVGARGAPRTSLSSASSSSSTSSSSTASSAAGASESSVGPSAA